MSSEVLEMYETLTNERREEVDNFIQSLVAQQERLEQNAKEEKLNGIAALRGCSRKICFTLTQIKICYFARTYRHAKSTCHIRRNIA